eukprot:TRINITY_DN13123_c0_g1_i1.p1 TRINITY_DN13123_c0_g1~~TRINITY_DN13123_c0_g1_i1.p1  ORF type:complete len:221 (-),score=58.48 TRINITY_DN13123_c0_g1_i1:137-739(-)
MCIRDRLFRAETIDQLPVNLPKIGTRLRDAVIMMIDGQDIDKIAQAYSEGDPILCLEDFGSVRDKDLEDGVIQTAKEKNIDEKIVKILTQLMKKVDLSSVKKELSALPKYERPTNEGTLVQQIVEPLPSETILKKFAFDFTGRMNGIEAKIAEMNAPSTQASVEISFKNYTGNLNDAYSKLQQSLLKVRSLRHLTLDFQE